MPGKRRGNDDGRHVAQLPEELAVQVVGTYLVLAAGDDLGALLVLPHEGRGPVALLVAIHAPDLFPSLLVERCQEGVLFVIVDNVDALAVKNRGSSSAPTEEHRIRVPFLGPELLAVHVVTKQPDVAEIRVDAFAFR